MMQKHRPILLWTVGCLSLLIIGVLVRIRTYDVITSGAQALWTQDELFVLVSQNKLGWSQNLWVFMWRLGKGALGIAAPPSFKRIDCIVYRITPEGTEEHLVKDVNAAGIFVPYAGSVYSIAGKDSQQILKWDGNRFAPVPPADAAAIQGSFTYADEPFKRWGWSQINPLLPVRSSADHELILNGCRMDLKATQTPDGGSSIELVKTDDPKNTRTLYGFKNKGGFLSAEEYKRFVE